MQFIAFLRGINVGGNNKVSMAELKVALAERGLANVKTYINSGNVLFESDTKDTDALTTVCEQAIEDQFGFPVGCVVLSAAEYKQEMDAAPDWWGDGNEHMRSDALFVLRKGTAQAVIDAVGAVDDTYEHIAMGKKVVFWTIDRRKYGRARLPKIIGTDVYRTVSMRSSTTSQKLYFLLTD